MKRSRYSAWLRPLLVAAMVFGLTAAPPLPGVQRAEAQRGTISLNQSRARIEQLVAKIGEATGRTILVPDDVRGTITIVAKRPVELDEAWAILESALSILGFSLLPSTVDTWRIARVAESVGEAPFRPVTEGDSDNFVTTLIPLRVADLQAVLKVIEPLSGSRVTLVPYSATNSLIASGSERAIARLTGLADELDRVEEATLRLRVLRYRGIDEVEPLVEGFLAAGGVALSRIQVWSDARTNALVVRGAAEGVERVVAFLDEVDQPIEGGGSIRILRVLHRDPEEVAELIRELADPVRSATNEARSAGGPLEGASFSIAVDGPSRSLVVRADPESHVAIREVLELIDVQPQLIAVDITVSELRTPESYGLSFGFQLPFSTGNDSSDLFGAFISQPTLPDVEATPTLFGRIQRDSGVSFETTENGVPVTVPILQSGSIAAVDFEATNEVLIQPSLIVTSGEQHEIFVGDNIPIPVTDTDAVDPDTTVGGVNVATLSRTTRFDRRDIGTRLAIEVSAGTRGKIQLDLEVELSRVDFSRAALGGDPTAVGPSYLEQLLVVTARLEDGETAVLAVDRRQKETKLRSGVPFFQDLPFLGFLFRTRGSQIDDVRLVIAARARRVSNPAELVADTIRRRLVFERRNARGAGLPAIEGPPYGVRVTTRRLRSDAEAIAESLALRGYETTTHQWTASDTDYYDVYVTRLTSLVDAAQIAETLSREGWQADLVVFSSQS